METLQAFSKQKAFLEEVGLLLFLTFLWGNGAVYTQSLSFEREYISVFNEGSSGVAVSVTDVNLDGLEDIVRFNDARELQLFLQLPEGGFTHYDHFAPLVFRQWNVLGFPLNDDRWLDWVSAGNDSGVNYWVSDSTGNYNYLRDNRYKFFAQGSNALDLDRSGDLDLFVCSDLSENYTLLNGGQIPFDRKFILPAGHPNTFFRSGNYGSVWEDINGDGIADLYVSKCSAFANHPSDPRRINQFYISQSDGSYEEVAHSWNVADSAQSWAASFADVNNDAYMDLLVINHDRPAALYINKQTHFEKSKSFEALDLEFNSVQVLAQDFDCDGYIDFLITGQKATVLMNEKGEGFSERADLLGRYQSSISTAQTGDFNQDGYLDIFAAQHGLYNNPSTREDLIFTNPFAEIGNNFVRFQMLDSIFYRMSGVQVEAHLFSQLGRQRRTLRIGESYGVCGSNILHFGLSKDTKIDSVIFIWPGGKKEVYFPENVNTNYLYTAGRGLRAELSLQIEDACFAAGDTTRILHLAENSGDLRIFRDDEEITLEESQEIHEDGRYFWIDKDASGSWIRSKLVRLPSSNALNTRLNYERDLSLCFGEELIVEPLEPENFLNWNTGDSLPLLNVRSSGEYQAVFANCGDTTRSEVLHVTYRPEVSLRVTNDTVRTGERATLRALGSDIYWYENTEAISPLQKGSELFLIPNLIKDTVFYAESREIHTRPDVVIGPIINENNQGPPTENPFFNAEMEFVAYEDCILKEITVRALDKGVRDFILRDLNGREINRSSYFLKADSTYALSLEWALDEGEAYVMTTDVRTNLSEYEKWGPQLYKVIQDSYAYPFTDGKYLSITGTNDGLNDFFYFTNWVISIAPDTCLSERKAVRAILDRTVNDHVLTSGNDVQIFPNPADDFFMLKISDLTNGTLQILSSEGRLVLEKKLQGGDQYRIFCSDWPAGRYTLLYNRGSKVSQYPLLILR